MAFAKSTLFNKSPPEEFTPWMNISDIKALFEDKAKVLIAIGGWGDTKGFHEAVKDEASIENYAKNVVDMVKKHGFDGVDIDWEYPGSPGEDNPNGDKNIEIQGFPKFLQAIRSKLDKGKELTLAVAAGKGGMAAFTPESSPDIWSSVDYINVMSYDLAIQGNNKVSHHTSVKGSLNAVQNYLELGLTPDKINLGFAFYAKYFTLDPQAKCTPEPFMCTLAPKDSKDGAGAGAAAAGAAGFTKPKITPPPPATNVTEDGTCGYLNSLRCPEGACCSAHGQCGNTTAHCGEGCQPQYGKCDAKIDMDALFRKALANGRTDDQQGGRYYVDEENKLFWTWDSTDMMERKFKEIVREKKLGGIMAWSLGQDSYDWSHLAAMQRGMMEGKGEDKKGQ
ncbi:hypothetical protein AJ79_09859 [Helicocarpus griseus UAMH5409]|uniref:chitinase n=1 Tax=Helicocarpus griseus UAMH5409 TaxID=1447875 RepID=A0A2B7WGT4_9EURO|nr:hypothetical protein AJ79_09859 [Helicocarpus griseus UAMH5409]